MKKNILSLVLAAITALMFGDTNAQLSKSSDAVASNSKREGGAVNKDALVVAISFRTLKNFNKMFTSTEARWYEIDDAYIAKFSRNSVETMVGYGKRGGWLYTIKR